VFTARLFRDGAPSAAIGSVAKLHDALLDPERYGWVDCVDPTHDELRHLERALGVHRLAMEAATASDERPKLERYGDVLFLAAYSVHFDPETAEATIASVRAFATSRLIVTLHSTDFDMAPIAARWDEPPEAAPHGVPFLLWGLLDSIIDDHFEAVQQLDAEVEATEDLLFGATPADAAVQRRCFALRKSLVLMRRVALPMREVMNTVMRRDVALVGEQLVPYYQDAYDHVLRVTEWTESLRDLVSALLDTQVAIQGNRMNLVMKKVTSWAAIIAVPTAITGFYGQNLPIPGIERQWGFVVSCVAIVAASLTLFAVFKKKDWL
jgi:magnesium transporter